MVAYFRLGKEGRHIFESALTLEQIESVTGKPSQQEKKEKKKTSNLPVSVSKLKDLEVKQLFEKGHSYKEIGKILGASCSAVGRVCKRLRLERHRGRRKNSERPVIDIA